MKKLFLPIVIILVLAGGFYTYTKQAKAPQDALPSITVTPTPSGTKSAPTPSSAGSDNPSKPAYSPPNSENQGESSGPDIQVYEVSFTGTAFEPQNIKVKKGDYVFFINNSNQDFWPITEDADHQAFNSLKAIKPQAQYKYQFLKSGIWQYSDKFNPEIKGSVEVTQ